jgi:hypothetical protein
VPADKPVAVAVVFTGVVFQLYVYGAVPPAGVAVAAPLVPPLQETFVCEADVALKAVGWVTTTETVVALLALSVMVTM